MKFCRSWFKWLVIIVALMVSIGSLGAERESQGVRNRQGDVIKILDEKGNVVDQQRPDATIVRRSDLPETQPMFIAQGELGGVDSLDRGAVNTVVCEDPATGAIVDEVGRIRTIEDYDASAPGKLIPSATAGATNITAADSVTVDLMTTGDSGTYQPAGTIVLIGKADTYYLNDGSSWRSGAGSYRTAVAPLGHVEVFGNTIRYVLEPPSDGILYEQTDYNAGEHSAQGTLGVVSPLVIETHLGSNTASMKGEAEILSNDMTSYGEPRFNYYSAIVGSVVPFEITYTLTNGTWTPDIFEGAFSYTSSGIVDFASPVSVPLVVDIDIRGSAKVPDESSIQYYALAQYDNGILKNVTDVAIWQVEPATLAGIDAGLLTTQKLETKEVILTIYAEYTEGSAHVETEKTVICVPDASADLPMEWEMYQGNSSHTGYVPISMDPEVLSLRWQRIVGSGLALNPVTAADDKVFVSLLVYFEDEPSLFVLDARDGELLWSKGFGRVFSVNPPSYAYGNVYIQTGNHGTETYLRAYDAVTGEIVYEAHHEAQWERYYAPTIFNGTVYINGGYYGGMYAFDAFSGAELWFHELPQYSDWTPAVDSTLAFAYVGEYSPGLYAVDRLSGERAFMIPDPNFDWDGWSMNLAPVLGTSNDAVAIHDGRLISFDLQAKSMRWELDRNFVGQPSVAHDAIYAIDGGDLVVLEEQSGAELWSWQPPEGKLSGTLIVTDTHVLATNETSVFAVELLTHTDVWSFPAAGHLALGDDTLYIASVDGTLTAISIPEYTPPALVELQIAGPAVVVENSSTQFRAFAFYEDGRVRDRTFGAEWSVDPLTYSNISGDGVMTTTELLEPVQHVMVRATYTERGVTAEAEIGVDLVVNVTLEQFIERNIIGAMEIEQKALPELEMAQNRKRAARAVLRDLLTNHGGHDLDRRSLHRALKYVRRAIERGEVSAWHVARSVLDLGKAVSNLRDERDKDR